ncbi:MAG: hypothetical protein ACRDMV_17050 [Streptosporangiales bacterium]
MAEQRRVVITGAAGRIGAAVTERLAGRWQIVGTDRPGHGIADLDVTGAATVRAARRLRSCRTLPGGRPLAYCRVRELVRAGGSDSIPPTTRGRSS